MRPFYTERAKDITIILLMITALFLTSIKFNLFFLPPSLSQDPKPVNDNLDQALRSIVLPSSIWIHFGGGNTTKAPIGDQRYYTEVRRLLRDQMPKGQRPELKNLTQFDKLKATKSMEIHFKPAVDSEVLSLSLGLASPIDSLPPIEVIFIPLVGQNTVYFISQGQAWSMHLEKTNALSLVDDLEKSRNYHRYYPFKDLYPQSKSFSLISLEDRPNLPSYEGDLVLDQQSKEDLAKTIFRQKYDFLNRIFQNDGTVIYAYNYGKEVLTLSSNGLIQYINTQIPTAQTEKHGSMLAAMEFMESLQLYMPSMRLHTMKKTTYKEKSAYNITFHYTVDFLPLYSELASQDITITVCGDQVVSFSGYSLSLGKKNQRPDFQPRNAEELLNLQYPNLKAKLGLLGPDDLFSRIKSLHSVYYLQGSTHIIPALQLQLDNKTFFYDYYTGEELQ